ncbi:hypothetical protein GQX74_010436 [Glossina fuscipes]|nr:hypothetical protein GQX74_010436 [Glossina fuscipes]
MTFSIFTARTKVDIMPLMSVDGDDDGGGGASNDNIAFVLMQGSLSINLIVIYIIYPHNIFYTYLRKFYMERATAHNSISSNKDKYSDYFFFFFYNSENHQQCPEYY